MKTHKLITSLMILLLLLCPVMGCTEDKAKEDSAPTTIEGVYETPSETGSFVRYTFFEDGTYECDIYTLNVLTGERRGTYTLGNGEITLLREGDNTPDTFPFEYLEESIIINGNTYNKKS